MTDVFEMVSLTIAQAGSDSSTAAVPNATQIQSMWDFLVKGGPVMIPIVLCSLVALTVVVERLVSLRRSLIIPANFLTGLRSALGGEGGVRQAMEYCKARPSPVARVFAAGLKRINEPTELMEKHIQDAGEREAMKMRKYLRVLAVIASLAPLLGLLGTIAGMIKAFQTVAASAEALGKTEMLATGIYEAMITTAAGLVVAIPAMVCYHWLTSRIDRLVMDIDQLTVDFVEEFSQAAKPGLKASRNGESHRLHASESPKPDAQPVPAVVS
jgi:biopolymer transport protein ExbB